MSLLPLVFRDMLRPLRMLEHQMRLADELFHPLATPMIKYQRSPVTEYSEDIESISHDRDKFQVKLDVQHFKPEEITVKTIDGNAIVIEGKHQEKQDNRGFISRQFVRRFVLPQGHNMHDVVSKLSSDGILTITAPRKVDPDNKEYLIPVTHAGPEREDTTTKKTEE